jgi:hypothetical protein
MVTMWLNIYSLYEMAQFLVILLGLIQYGYYVVDHIISLLEGLVTFTNFIQHLHSPYNIGERTCGPDHLCIHFSCQC